MRDQVKLKVSKALEEGSLDESKFNQSVGVLVDSIIEQAVFEAKAECKEMIRRLQEKDPEPVKDHRSFGKVRNPGDPV